MICGISAKFLDDTGSAMERVSAREMVIVKPELNDEVISGLHIRVISNLGYKRGIKPGSDIEKILRKAIDSVVNSSKPMGIYRIVPVSEVNKKEIITDAGVIRSQMFARMAELCKGKRALAFMIATIGDGWRGELGKNASVLKQFLFDAVASELSEMVADMVERRWLADIKGAGLKASLRFSPGYCDWELKEQAVIFSALDSHKIGVRLSRYYVMIPEKSISGVNLLAGELIAKAPCIFCKKECGNRKIPSKFLD